MGLCGNSGLALTCFEILQYESVSLVKVDYIRRYSNAFTVIVQFQSKINTKALLRF